MRPLPPLPLGRQGHPVLRRRQDRGRDRRQDRGRHPLPGSEKGTDLIKKPIKDSAERRSVSGRTLPHRTRANDYATTGTSPGGTPAWSRGGRRRHVTREGCGWTGWGGGGGRSQGTWVWRSRQAGDMRRGTGHREVRSGARRRGPRRTPRPEPAPFPARIVMSTLQNVM